MATDLFGRRQCGVPTIDTFVNIVRQKKKKKKYPSDCNSDFSILILGRVTTAAEGSTTCQRPLDRRTIFRMAMNSTKLLDDEVSFGMPWLVDDIVEEVDD